MITGYVSYEKIPGDDVADGYYYGRLAMIERAAAEHGLPARRVSDGTGEADEVLYLEVSLELRFGEGASEAPEASDGWPENEDDWDRYADFLVALEDSDLGYLLHEVDNDHERRLLESVPVAIASVEKRGEGFAGETREVGPGDGG